MNDEQIINAIRLSPQTGIDYAIQAYGGAVKAICKAILAAYSDGDVEEAVSDTFFALWHDIGKYDANKAAFRSYIYGIFMKKLVSVLLTVSMLCGMSAQVFAKETASGMEGVLNSVKSRITIDLPPFIS